MVGAHDASRAYVQALEELSRFRVLLMALCDEEGMDAADSGKTLRYTLTAMNSGI